MTTVAVSKSETQLTEALKRMKAEGDRIVLEQEGEPVGAIVSMDDLHMLEELEDRLDELAALEALAESNERIPYDKVRKELGL